MWAFKTLWDKGLIYEGFRVLAVLLAVRDAAVSNTETRMDDVYRDRQDPALTVLVRARRPAERMPGLDDDAVDAAVEPRARRRARHRLRGDGGGRRSATSSPRPGSAHYERELAGATRVGTVKGGELVGRRYTPLFPFFADTAQRVPGARRRLRVDRGRHRRRAHGARLRRGRPERLQRRRHPDRRARWTSTAGSPPRSPPWAGVHVFDANPRRHPRPQGRRPSCVRHETYDHSYPHCWRCDTAARLPGDRRRGSCRSPRSATAWSSSTSRSHWVPEHVKDGSFGKWLANARDWSISRNRFWGSPIPVWKSDDPRYPRIDVYGSHRRARARLRRRGRPTCTARSSTTSSRPNPDDPTGQSMMRRVPEVLDCWFESGSMPFAQVHYPFENARVVRGPLPRRLHRRVHRPDPRLVLHAARAGHGAVRPAGVPDVRQPRHRARRRRPEDVEEPAQLPRPDRGVRHLRLRRDALVPAVVADPARRRPRR